MSERFGVPVAIENNLRSIALAELWNGGGRGLRSFVCLGVRSGIGLGIVVDGQLLRGAKTGRRNRPLGFPRRGFRLCGRRPGKRPKTSPLSVPSLTTLGIADCRRTQSPLQPAPAAARGPGSAGGSRHAWVVHQLATLLDPERLVVAGPLVEAEVYLTALTAAASGFGGAALAEKLTPSTLGP